MDSNHRYPEREACFFPDRNSLSGTASRRGRAVGVSNGAEREPPDLRISLLAGARAVGPGQQVAAAGLVRPIFPGAPGLDRIDEVDPVCETAGAVS